MQFKSTRKNGLFFRFASLCISHHLYYVIVKSSKKRCQDVLQFGHERINDMSDANFKQ